MQIINSQWRSTLLATGLGDFESIWSFSLERVDAPNQGRGGWSEVCYYRLPEAVSGVKALYIKRQQNYTFFNWRRPFSGTLTFEREYNNLTWCLERGLPVVKPVAFGAQYQGGQNKAILITQALDDYFSLAEAGVVEKLGVRLRRQVIRAVADILRDLHAAGLQHGCLYPKHIFINHSCQQGEDIEVRLIDFEKASALSRWNKGIYRDLDTLNRRSYGWSNHDKLNFLFAYYSGNRDRVRSSLYKLRRM